MQSDKILAQQNGSKKNNVQEQNDLAPLFIFSDSASRFHGCYAGEVKGVGGGRGENGNE